MSIQSLIKNKHFIVVTNSLSQSSCHSSSPVVVVKHDESTVSTAKGDLIVAVVPPVGMRLSTHHITEMDHVPEGRNQGKQL